MNQSVLLKILCSLPVIFLGLYFLPFLGICLVILRYILSSRKKKNFTIWCFILAALFLFLPKGLQMLGTVIDFPFIASVDQVVQTELYGKLLTFAALLMTIGVILLIVVTLFQKVLEKLEQYLKTYIRTKEAKNEEISRQNDMEIKKKQEAAKNTHVVYCPYCGADNMLVGSVGTCKYCRRKIEYKNK